MTNELIITALTPQGDITSWLRSQCQPSVKYVLKLSKWQKKRTLDQNGQSHVWYEQLAKELTEYDELGWKRFCKLNYGVPILRAHDAEFRALYDKCIKSTLTYEEKINAMDYLPVTSLMTAEQFNQYFESLQNNFIKRGVKLEFLK